MEGFYLHECMYVCACADAMWWCGMTFNRFHDNIMCGIFSIVLITFLSIEIFMTPSLDLKCVDISVIFLTS